MDHLPECHYGEPVRGGHILHCICDRLRAHGDRVRREVVKQYNATWQENLALVIERTRGEERQRIVDRLQAAIDSGSEINARGCVQLLRSEP